MDGLCGSVRRLLVTRAFRTASRSGLGSIPIGVCYAGAVLCWLFNKGWDDGTPPLFSIPTSDSILFVQCHLPESSEFSATSPSQSWQDISRSLCNVSVRDLSNRSLGKISLQAPYKIYKRSLGKISWGDLFRSAPKELCWEDLSKRPLGKISVQDI